jgi:F-box domain
LPIKPLLLIKFQDLLWGFEHSDLQPKSSHSVLKTPSSHNMLDSALDLTVFKTPCDASEDMEDSGYSTCHSNSSIKNLSASSFCFKTPCCPPVLKSSRSQRIIPRIPPGFKSKDGLAYLDIVSSLNQIDVLDQLLTFLTPDDLVRCSLVSKKWNSIIKDNRVSRRKRVAFFSSRTLTNKENLTRVCKFWFLLFLLIMNRM